MSHSPTIVIVPGWKNSGPGHWQSLWAERLPGAVRVTMAEEDWQRPKQAVWLQAIGMTILAQPGPVVVVAHSLGCILVAAWASVSRHTARVRGALLVAPGDTEALELKDRLPGWSPISRQRLPFRSILVGSQNDPYCTADRAQALAQAWGARWVNLGAAGHINADSSLGEWPEGQALLQTLLKD
jgi:predicted alpha/beta hydrolase family esterase